MCNGINACSGLGEDFELKNYGCSREYACAENTGTVKVKDYSCISGETCYLNNGNIDKGGDATCHDNNGNLFVGDHSCNTLQAYTGNDDDLSVGNG
jgi:hypothetical protein